MENTSGTLEIVLTGMARVLSPLLAAMQLGGHVRELLGQLGYPITEAQENTLAPVTRGVAAALTELFDATADVIAAAESEDSNLILEKSAVALPKLALAIASFVDLKNAVDDLDLPGVISADVAELPNRLFSYLLVENLERKPGLAELFELLGVLERTQRNVDSTDPHHPEYTVSCFDFRRLLAWLMDPGKQLLDLYAWGDPQFDGSMLFPKLEKLIASTGLPVIYDEVPPQLDMVLVKLGAPPTLDPRGLLLEVGTQFNSGDLEFPNGDFTLTASLGFSAPPGMEITLQPYGDINLLPPDPTVEIAGDFDLKVEVHGGPYVLLGEAGGSRLELDDISARIGARLKWSQDHDRSLGNLSFGASIGRGNVVIDNSGADGFLSKLLPDTKIEGEFGLAIGFDRDGGFYISGSSTLEIVLPLHVTLGPINLKTLTVLVAPSDEALDVVLGFDIGAELGPFTAIVQRFGVQSKISFPSGGGNLGLLQFGMGMLHPTGAALSIETGLTGGGFLDFDEINERYSGILALEFGEIGITAIGLITTKLPDGSKGFSMLLSIGIKFNPPIQLPLGFTLSAVGGLIGVNRTMVIDTLREGFRKGTLESILFPDPQWVIPNANQVISDLRSVFAPTEDRFVIGPMLKIGYGTPNFITGEIGIFLELPDPVRIVLLGHLEMSLPEPSAEIIAVNIDILGVLDFQKRELSFQASIHASRLLTFELFGDCALFLRWGAQPELALALGGFHPKFAPPAPQSIFADLRRLTVGINYKSIVQLACRGYLAVTPNSLQFGGRLEVFIGIREIDLGIAGFLSFDALFYFSPFAFDVAISGGVAVSIAGVSLANLLVSFNLSGPTPWNIRGKGRIKILFFSISVRFHVTWGGQGKAIEAIDPWLEVRKALSQATSWGSQLPAGTASVVALRNMEAESEDTIVVHPAGRLEIRQNVVPLGLRLGKLGNAPVKDHDMVSIDRIVAGANDGLDFEPVEEYFALGQFEELSDAQQLSTPAFERMEAGVITSGSTEIRPHGDVESASVGYESILIGSDRIAQPPQPAAATWSIARRLAAGTASARARERGAARYATRRPPLVKVEEESSILVDAATLEPVQLQDTIGVRNRLRSRFAADQALADYVASTRASPGAIAVAPASAALQGRQPR